MKKLIVIAMCFLMVLGSICIGQLAYADDAAGYGRAGGGQGDGWTYQEWQDY